MTFSLYLYCTTRINKKLKKVTWPNAMKKKDKTTNSLTQVGTKRVERDHKHKYGSNTKKEKNKRHKVLADETKQTIPMAAAAFQSCRTPWSSWTGTAGGLGTVRQFRYLPIWGACWTTKLLPTAIVFSISYLFWMDPMHNFITQLLETKLYLSP